MRMCLRAKKKKKKHLPHGSVQGYPLAKTNWIWHGSLLSATLCPKRRATPKARCDFSKSWQSTETCRRIQRLVCRCSDICSTCCRRCKDWTCDAADSEGLKWAQFSGLLFTISSHFVLFFRRHCQQHSAEHSSNTGGLFFSDGPSRPVSVVKLCFNLKCFCIPKPAASDFRGDKKQEVSTACRPQGRSPKKKKKSTLGAAAEEISLDAAVASFLSEADDIFTSQQQQRKEAAEGFISVEVRPCLHSWLALAGVAGARWRQTVCMFHSDAPAGALTQV